MVRMLKHDNELKPRLVVLISGRGSNLCAISDAIQTNQLHADLVGVISNRQNAKGLQEAEKRGIPTFCRHQASYKNQQSFENALLGQLKKLKPDVIVLAGFMSILSSQFVAAYRGKIVNIHPSLLPKHKGLHTHRRALAAKDTKHGCTTHFVTEKLDDATAIIMQATVAVKTKDTKETLAQRVLAQEHRLYPKTLELLCRKQIVYDKNRCFYNGKALEEPLRLEQLT